MNCPGLFAGDCVPGWGVSAPSEALTTKMVPPKRSAMRQMAGNFNEEPFGGGRELKSLGGCTGRRSSGDQRPLQVLASRSPAPGGRRSSSLPRQPAGATFILTDAATKKDAQQSGSGLPPHSRGGSTATRKPRLRLAVDGRNAPRQADRHEEAGDVQPPPRKTRLVPAGGPAGSLIGVPE
jgi:hypothetical protein